jgi:uncharacterized protein YbjT (DUF2867 family)
MSSLTAQAKKKIVVFPATGWQGRWVCECLSKDPQYEVVGIARNPDGPKANSTCCSHLVMIAARGGGRECFWYYKTDC